MNDINSDDLTQDQTVQLPDDNDDTKSPSRQDEEWQEGVEFDDDVDELGEEVGVTYEQDEELNIEEKVPLTTESDPPEDPDEQE